MVWWADRYRSAPVPNYDAVGSFPFLVLMMLNQLSTFAVPAFLFISGFYISYAARNPSATLSWKVVRARVVDLVVPYLVWSTLIFIVDAVLGQTYSPMAYAAKILTGKANAAFFFVPLLLQLYLISPFIVYYAKMKPKLFLGVSSFIPICLTIFVYLQQLSTFFHNFSILIDELDWLFLRSVFFFSLGLVYSFYSPQISARLARHSRSLIFLTLVLAILSIFEVMMFYSLTHDWDAAFIQRRLFNRLYVFSLLLTLMTWDAWPAKLSRALSRALGRVGALSYGVYLLHPKLLELVSRIVYHVAPSLLGQYLAFAAILFLLGVGCPWLLMHLVASLPERRIYHWLFG